MAEPTQTPYPPTAQGQGLVGRPGLGHHHRWTQEQSPRKRPSACSPLVCWQAQWEANEATCNVEHKEDHNLRN